MKALEAASAQFLASLGTPSDDPEIVGTPGRLATLWRDNLVSGYGRDPAEILSKTIPDTSNTIITLTSVPFHGICPHHLLPYHGVVHLAYEPAGRIVGLGRLEQLVCTLSRRLVLQEALTRTLVDALVTHLGARGAACGIDAEHLCLILQGREPRSARMHTRLGWGTLVDRADILPPVEAATRCDMRR